MNRAGPPQAANSAPTGASAAAQPQAWGDHTSAAHSAAPAGWSCQALVHLDDDVAVALRDLAPGEPVDVRRAGTIERARMTDAIPLGHKFALRALAAGTPIRKYGECIGAATADIPAGVHVHVHNLASRRARQAA